MEALRFWMEYEDDAVCRLYPSASWGIIEVALPGRSRSAVYKRAFKLGVKRVQRDFPPETRAKLADLARENKPRKDRGLVAPVFVRAGVAGKVCTKCLEWLPLVNFALHETCAGGRRNTCTTCAGRQAYAANPELRIAAVRKYQAAYPDAHRERKRAADRRRHGRKMAGRGVSVAEYRKIMKIFGGLCVYCADKAETMDHVIPLSRGGKHEPENLVPACKKCNFAKHTKTPAEWLGIEEA